MSKNPLKETEGGEQWYQAVKQGEESLTELSRKIGRTFGVQDDEN